MLARLWITLAMLGHKPAGYPGVIHRFLKDLVGAKIFSHTGAMNNTHWYSEHQPYPLPTAPAHPTQPIGVRPPHETNKLNPYGLTALVMVLLMICIGFINLIFFNWELRIVLPTGFTWLGAMGFGIGALFMKNREKNNRDHRPHSGRARYSFCSPDRLPGGHFHHVGEWRLRLEDELAAPLLIPGYDLLFSGHQPGVVWAG